MDDGIAADEVAASGGGGGGSEVQVVIAGRVAGYHGGRNRGKGGRVFAATLAASATTATATTTTARGLAQDESASPVLLVFDVVPPSSPFHIDLVVRYVRRRGRPFAQRVRPDSDVVDRAESRSEHVGVVVDREQGARQNIESAGYVFESLFTKSDLGIDE